MATLISCDIGSVACRTLVDEPDVGREATGDFIAEPQAGFKLPKSRANAQFRFVRE